MQPDELKSHLRALTQSTAFAGLVEALAVSDRQALDAIRTLTDEAAVEAREVIRANERLRGYFREALNPKDRDPFHA